MGGGPGKTESDPAREWAQDLSSGTRPPGGRTRNLAG